MGAPPRSTVSLPPVGAEQEAEVTESLVREVVRQRLEALELLDGAVIAISCTPPRCLAEVRGPKLGSALPPQLADEVSEATGREFEVVATMHTSLVGEHATAFNAAFMAFYPADGSRDDAANDVTAALRSFKDDLSAGEGL